MFLFLQQKDKVFHFLDNNQMVCLLECLNYLYIQFVVRFVCTKEFNEE